MLLFAMKFCLAAIMLKCVPAATLRPHNVSIQTLKTFALFIRARSASTAII